MNSLERGGTCARPSSLNPQGASLIGMLSSTGTTVWRKQPEQPVRAIHCEKHARMPRTIMARALLLRREPVDLMRRLPNRLPPLCCFLPPKKLLSIPQQVTPHDRRLNSRQGILGTHQNVGADH